MSTRETKRNDNRLHGPRRFLRDVLVILLVLVLLVGVGTLAVANIVYPGSVGKNDVGNPLADTRYVLLIDTKDNELTSAILATIDLKGNRVYFYAVAEANDPAFKVTGNYTTRADALVDKVKEAQKLARIDAYLQFNFGTPDADGFLLKLMSEASTKEVFANKNPITWVKEAITDCGNIRTNMNRWQMMLWLPEICDAPSYYTGTVWALDGTLSQPVATNMVAIPWVIICPLILVLLIVLVAVVGHKKPIAQFDEEDEEDEAAAEKAEKAKHKTHGGFRRFVRVILIIVLVLDLLVGAGAAALTVAFKFEPASVPALDVEEIENAQESLTDELKNTIFANYRNNKIHAEGLKNSDVTNILLAVIGHDALEHAYVLTIDKASNSMVLTKLMTDTVAYTKFASRSFYGELADIYRLGGQVYLSDAVTGMTGIPVSGYAEMDAGMMQGVLEQVVKSMPALTNARIDDDLTVDAVNAMIDRIARFFGTSNPETYYVHKNLSGKDFGMLAGVREDDTARMLRTLAYLLVPNETGNVSDMGAVFSRAKTYIKNGLLSTGVFNTVSVLHQNRDKLNSNFSCWQMLGQALEVAGWQNTMSADRIEVVVCQSTQTEDNGNLYSIIPAGFVSEVAELYGTQSAQNNTKFAPNWGVIYIVFTLVLIVLIALLRPRKNSDVLTGEEFGDRMEQLERAVHNAEKEAREARIAANTAAENLRNHRMVALQKDASEEEPEVAAEQKPKRAEAKAQQETKKEKKAEESGKSTKVLPAAVVAEEDDEDEGEDGEEVDSNPVKKTRAQKKRELEETKQRIADEKIAEAREKIAEAKEAKLARARKRYDDYRTAELTARQQKTVAIHNGTYEELPEQNDAVLQMLPQNQIEDVAANADSDATVKPEESANDAGTGAVAQSAEIQKLMEIAASLHEQVLAARSAAENACNAVQTLAEQQKTVAETAAANAVAAATAGAVVAATENKPATEEPKQEKVLTPKEARAEKKRKAQEREAEKRRLIAESMEEKKELERKKAEAQKAVAQLLKEEAKQNAILDAEEAKLQAEYEKAQRYADKLAAEAERRRNG